MAGEIFGGNHRQIGNPAIDRRDRLHVVAELRFDDDGAILFLFHDFLEGEVAPVVKAVGYLGRYQDSNDYVTLTCTQKQD